MLDSLLPWLATKGNQLLNILILKPNFKLTEIWFIFVIGSFSHDYLPLPHCYFSRPTNLLNQFFVKIGWGWTFILVSLYMGSVLAKHRIDSTIVYAKHLGRLLTLTAFWFVCTSVFDYIEGYTGNCVGGEPHLITKALCRKKGFLWNGFDISGHAFLLSFCILIINGELRRVRKHLNNNTTSATTQNHVTDEAIVVFGFVRLQEKFLEGAVETFKVCLVLLMLLWEVMLLITCLYHHEMIQKLLGLVFGAGSYFLCYGLLFKHEGLLLLGNPYNAGSKSL